jgi:AcrR family transcriptional regulator
MSPRVYTSARERILDACERVILRDGLGGLSIDAVIAEAKLSKGGFFHHFASKDELLGAVTERLGGVVVAEIDARAARDREPHGRRLRALIEVAFDMAPARRDRLRALVLAMIEAASSNPTVVAIARADNDQAVARGVAEGVPLGNVLAVQLALDGHWLGESLGTLALAPAARTALRKALIALTLPAPRRRKAKR